MIINKILPAIADTFLFVLQFLLLAVAYWCVIFAVSVVIVLTIEYPVIMLSGIAALALVSYGVYEAIQWLCSERDDKVDIPRISIPDDEVSSEGNRLASEDIMPVMPAFDDAMPARLASKRALDLGENPGKELLYRHFDHEQKDTFGGKLMRQYF